MMFKDSECSFTMRYEEERLKRTIMSPRTTPKVTRPVSPVTPSFERSNAKSRNYQAPRIKHSRSFINILPSYSMKQGLLGKRKSEASVRSFSLPFSRTVIETKHSTWSKGNVINNRYIVG